MRLSVPIISCCLLLLGTALAQGFGVQCDVVQPPPKILTWNITEVTIEDGSVPLIQYIEINNKWPADPITITLCQTVILTVNNQLPNDLVTLHFHGLLMRGGNTINDGTQGLTQSGIPPQGNFTYTVGADHPGTFWIHSHSPGQYPQGLRAPFIVYPDISDPPIVYPNEGLVTLSDWWPNFKYAENKSLTTVEADRCGSPTSATGGGIEYPPQKVTINDVHGYNAALGEDDKTYTLASCSDQKRLRFVNLSSHSRFYIAFNDSRTFNITELDGIDYQPFTAHFLDLSPGQRASILVGGYDEASQYCSSAYLLAFSDPKISHGTARCPMQFPTDGSGQAYGGVQYTHAYLEITGKESLDKAQDLFPGPYTFPVEWLQIWTTKADLNDPNFQPIPGNNYKIMEVLPDSQFQNTFKNRLHFIDYFTEWWNPANRTDYGTEPTASRTGAGIISPSLSNALEMEPQEIIPMWFPDQAQVDDIANYMHYIELSSVDTGVNPALGGFAAMMENLGSTTGDGILQRWFSPDTQVQASDPTFPQLPTLFRMLQAGLTDSTLETEATYESSDPNNRPGRTILIDEAHANFPHWFIIKSELGDHPMHLHGHHFEILAVLPPSWYQQDRHVLYDLVADYRIDSRLGISWRGNPPRRDTMMIEKGLTYVIAIDFASVTGTNPGVWAFHCHNDIHSTGGMLAQVVERPLELRKILGTWGLGYIPKIIPDLVILDWNGKSTGDDGTSYGTVAQISKWMQQSFNTAVDAYRWREAGLLVAVTNHPALKKLRKWRRNLPDCCY